MIDNSLGSLNEILFETLRDLRAGKIDLDRAAAIRETAQTVINSAKVEVDYVRATEGRRGTTGLIDSGPKAIPREALPNGPETKRWGNGGA
jgi:hypothetical protein